MNKCERNQIDAAIPLFLRQEMRSVGATVRIDRPGGGLAFPGPAHGEAGGQNRSPIRPLGLAPRDFSSNQACPDFLFL